MKMRFINPRPEVLSGEEFLVIYTFSDGSNSFLRFREMSTLLEILHRVNDSGGFIDHVVDLNGLRIYSVFLK